MIINLGGSSLVEEESLDELVVLRARRDTGKTKREANEDPTSTPDDGSGLGNRCRSKLKDCKF